MHHTMSSFENPQERLLFGLSIRKKSSTSVPQKVPFPAVAVVRQCDSSSILFSLASTKLGTTAAAAAETVWTLSACI